MDKRAEEVIIMTDKKLTDNDIVMVLENAEYKVNGVVTQGFYLSGDTFNAVLDLINRQKAEIERLTAERDAMHQDVIAAEEYAWQCKTAKVEAIKEFAERVEPLKKFRSCMGNSVYELSVTMREIDDILKEMVGDNNAE